MRATCAELAAWSRAKLTGSSDTVIVGVSTDTRRLRPGELFVAIRGPRYDGHDFLDQAIAGRAGALLISRSEHAPYDVPCLEVEDTVVALGEIARAYRSGFAGPVVGITGSNGKTTTKELCTEVLNAAGVQARRSPGNLNNAIGLPLSVLGLEAGDDALVVELGMNRPGEIDALARIAAPTVGAITQVASAHLEGVGSLEDVSRSKAELLDRLPPDGAAVLNAEDALVVRQAGRFKGRKLWFGLDESCDFRAEEIRQEETGTAFRLSTPAGAGEVRMRLPGRHVALLAACAAACAFATGLLGSSPLEAMREGIARFAGVRGRLQLSRTSSGLQVLDDTYNANPSSVRSALETLREVAAGGRTIAVLADMLELGDAEETLHAEIGTEAGRFGIDVLLAVGSRSRATAAAARAAGVANVLVADDAEEARNMLPEIVRASDTVLVKGSRGMGMERALAALEEVG